MQIDKDLLCAILRRGAELPHGTYWMDSESEYEFEGYTVEQVRFHVEECHYQGWMRDLPSNVKAPDQAIYHLTLAGTDRLSQCRQP